MAAQQKRQQAQTGVAALFVRAQPFLEGASIMLDVVWPHVKAGVDLAARLWAQYGAEEVAHILIGLLLLFFGGQFPVLIASVEAFRMTGWESMKHSVLILHRQYQAAREASKKDDQLDENRDGIADVHQIDKQQLATRKLMVFLKSTDPQSVNEGLHGVSAGLTAVVATLRMQFAQTITLGVALGDVFTESAQKYLSPALIAALPREYHKWIDVGINYLCRSLACTIAWWCQRIISALHCAMRGSSLLLTGLDKALRRRDIQVPFDLLSPHHAMFAGTCTAIGSIGFYSQASAGFRLPFPLNILLLPLRLLEWALYLVVSYAK